MNSWWNKPSDSIAWLLFLELPFNVRPVYLQLFSKLCRKFSPPLPLSDSLRLANAVSLASCVPMSIYTPVWAAAPTLSCTNSHSHLLRSPPNPEGTLLHRQSRLCQKSSARSACHDYALDVSASLTGSNVCLCRRCTWGRRPSARWMGSTSTAHTSPEWRPLMQVEWASTARLWSCRPVRVR